MKLISWNVAGLRACYKRDLWNLLKEKMPILSVYKKQKC